jgi:serine/threonine protein kinase
MLGSFSNVPSHHQQNYQRTHIEENSKQIDTVNSLKTRFDKLRGGPDSQGAYGQIIKVKSRVTGRSHALKQTEIEEGGGVSPPTLREIVIMQELKHVNVMRYYFVVLMHF